MLFAGLNLPKDSPVGFTSAKEFTAEKEFTTEEMTEGGTGLEQVVVQYGVTFC
jgi:hypothetical protein